MTARHLSLVGLLFLSACANDDRTTDDVGSDVGDILDSDADNPLLPRVDNTTCVFPDTAALGDYTVAPAFPNLNSPALPIWVGSPPNDPNTLVVASQDGTIVAFDNDPAVSESTRMASLPVLRAGDEEGLLGLAFHPDYADNGRAFVHYSSNVDCPDDAQRCNVVAELQRSGPRTLADEERRILTVAQPYANHNGGAIAFGPDGYLYISIGDGGSGGDPENNGQDPFTLLGAVLRIDVDNSPNGADYGIPHDNPFVDGGGAPEVWAWGLRNTWRMSFDAETGDLWGADVGQNRAEEVNVLQAGKNYGWNVREGFECYNASSCADSFTEPILEYGRDLGQSVTGGFVYRGEAFPELWGHYLYGDYVSGRLWAYDPVTDSSIELATAVTLTSFGTTSDGDILLVSRSGGTQMLRRTDVPIESLPARLSDTGCFQDVAALLPAAGVIAYDVNVPLYSDGAVKRRWFALPAETSATTDRTTGQMSFPDGTVFIKHFEITEDDGTVRWLETRFFVNTSQGFRGFTYRWNEDQTDAELVGAAGGSTQVVVDGAALEWQFPARNACLTCHTSASGQVLGFRTQQLDGPRVGDLPQLAVFIDAGYVDGAADNAPYPDLDDAQASVADRARAYLATQCAMCHLPSGGAATDMDLRYSVTLADTGTCDVAPTRGGFDLPNARRINPGDADTSVLIHRMASRDAGQMPPLATERVDAAGLALISDWIDGLDGCGN